MNSVRPITNLMTTTSAESWDSAHAYEQYIGRWSRRIAACFLRWLALSPGLAWADVGCGTGALLSTILTLNTPASVFGIDSSNGFVSQTRERIRDSLAHFLIGDAAHLSWPSSIFDVAVSGLVLNFVRDPDAMTREMITRNETRWMGRNLCLGLCWWHADDAILLGCCHDHKPE